MKMTMAQQTVFLLMIVLALCRDATAAGLGCTGRNCVKGMTSDGARRTRLLRKKEKKSMDSKFKSKMAHSRKLSKASFSSVSDGDSQSNSRTSASNSRKGVSVSNTASRTSAARISNDIPTTLGPITPGPTPMTTTPPVSTTPPVIPPTNSPISVPTKMPTPMPTSPPTPGPSKRPTMGSTTAPSKTATVTSIQFAPTVSPRIDAPTGTTPPSPPLSDFCDINLELTCNATIDGTPCDDLTVDPTDAANCSVNLTFTYRLVNEGIGPVLVNEYAREFNGQTVDLVEDDLVVLGIGPESSVMIIEEVLVVNLCGDGSVTVAGALADSVMADGVSCSAFADHSLVGPDPAV